MVILDLKLRNIYGFDDFHINLSYPRKLKRTTIENEYLEDRPTFRYKKAIVVMGANATGKTTMGKAINTVLNYMNEGNPTLLYKMVGDKTKEASFSIDYVPSGKKQLVRFSSVIHPSKSLDLNPEIENRFGICDIRMGDTYEKCAQQLEENGLRKLQPQDFASVFGVIGFRFNFSKQQDLLDMKSLEDKECFLKTLNCIMKTLDPSVVEVKESKEFEDSFVILRGGNQILIQRGVLQDSGNILSSGTREGVHIATLIASIKQHLNGFYYCDEQFSHIQSNIKKRLFSIMVGLLGDAEQLFFTTHNSAMQDLNLPKHSFAYLRKKKIGEECHISVGFASEVLKRDTDSVRNAAENDMFDSLPDDSLLDQLEEV